MKLPAYFELNGKYASMVQDADGGVTVNVPDNMYIADFMDKGREISKEDFDKATGSQAAS